MPGAWFLSVAVKQFVSAWFSVWTTAGPCSYPLLCLVLHCANCCTSPVPLGTPGVGAAAETCRFLFLCLALLVANCCTSPAPLGPPGSGAGAGSYITTRFLGRCGGFGRCPRPNGWSRFDQNAGRGYKNPRLGSRLTK